MHVLQHASKSESVLYFVDAILEALRVTHESSLSLQRDIEHDHKIDLRVPLRDLTKAQLEVRATIVIYHEPSCGHRYTTSAIEASSPNKETRS